MTDTDHKSTAGTQQQCEEEEGLGDNAHKYACTSKQGDAGSSNHRQRVIVEPLPDDLPQDLGLVVAGEQPPFLDLAIHRDRHGEAEPDGGLTLANGAEQGHWLVFMTHRKRCSYRRNLLRLN